MQLLDGKNAAERLKKEIALEAAEVTQNRGFKPHLAAILIGNNGASETYVASKMKSCHEVGFLSTVHRFEASIAQTKLLEKIEELNKNATVDGIIVQLPLPNHMDVEKITSAISYKKDVDGFHPLNLGRMLRNLPCYIPATPYGILLLLKFYGIETCGKHCVVIGRSMIVGSPISILMARNAYPGNCSVTLVHSKTHNLTELVQSADLIIAAIGRKNFITANMLKPGAVVIDVGINRESSKATSSGYKLYGDVDFEQVAPITSWITPVPGGVGPMTIVGLLKNTLASAKNEIYKR